MAVGSSKAKQSQLSNKRQGTAFASLAGSGFFDKLAARARAIDSLLCVGLDPHVGQLTDKSASGALAFCKRLIDATADVALAYKPNAAFFEAFGAEGMAALKDYIPAEIPIVLDAKRGDIGTTAQAYADAAFTELGAESITINAYMGTDTVAPFIKDPSRGVFVLCKTSNPSSKEVQSLRLAGSNLAVFEQVAALAQGWNTANNVGLVVGATDADALRRARAAAPGLWILAPGIGAQGGDLDAACAAGLDANGLGLLVPISRGISAAKDPAAAAREFRDNINKARTAAAAASADQVCEQAEGMAPYQKDFIDFALSQNVLRFGSFTLKSGRQSPYFFNAGLFSTGQALAKLGRFYAQAIVDAGDKLDFTVVFGPAYKGIPLGAAVAHTLYEGHGSDVEYTYNRKEKKDHGEGGLLVGADVKGKRVLIVDDVITAGTAIREAMDMLTAAGAVPAGVVIALDRMEKGGGSELSAVQQVEKEFGIPVVSVVCLTHIASYLTAGQDPALLQAITEYRDKYGVQA
ncbi:orotidine-5'-phosphate decarboxylase [Tribonema minus]|uniref:Orotidine 5'-phosphate decarboxylase n=1 Tax=Tribonema minus TaxID=303371 RepID=A0A835Z0K1_9STRA|nr:orotidine-5'-phosphate decarboxylase [Tribonema minus]